MRAPPIRRNAPSYSGPAWLGRTPHLVADNRGLIGYGLGKSFKRRPVLRDVSVSVQRGEVVGLLGPNGAGKTTCFYIITGLIAADTGTVELDGQDPGTVATQFLQSAGLLPQPSIGATTTSTEG